MQRRVSSTQNVNWREAQAEQTQHSFESIAFPSLFGQETFNQMNRTHCISTIGRIYVRMQYHQRGTPHVHMLINTFE